MQIDFTQSISFLSRFSIPDLKKDTTCNFQENEDGGNNSKIPPSPTQYPGPVKSQILQLKQNVETTSVKVSQKEILISIKI